MDESDNQDRVEPGRRAGRSRAAWVTAALLAALILVGVPVVVGLVEDGGRRIRIGPEPDRAPRGWRVESYAGVQVRVPPFWGWGATPVPGAAGPLDCGVTTFVTLGGRILEMEETAPNVGQPVPMRDHCLAVPDVARVDPSRTSVWLGAPVPEGTVDLGNGFVRETVMLGEVTVTVTSDHVRLRRLVLRTAELVDLDANGCLTAPSTGPPPASPASPRADPEPAACAPESLSVCAYALGDGSAYLLWSAGSDAAEAAAYDAAYRTASSGPVLDHCGRSANEWIAVGVHGRAGGTGEPVTRWDLVDPACGTLNGVQLSAALVEPWATGWLRAYVAGPADSQTAAFFRGPLG